MSSTLSSDIFEKHTDFLSGVRLHNLKQEIFRVRSRLEAVVLFELLSLMVGIRPQDKKNILPLIKLAKTKLNSFDTIKSDSSALT